LKHKRTPLTSAGWTLANTIANSIIKWAEKRANRTFAYALVNVLRLSLHPDGLAPRIVDLAAWRAHVFARLRRQVEIMADPELEGLLEELERYPAPADAREPAIDRAIAGVVVPLLLRTELGGSRCLVRQQSSARRSTSPWPSSQSSRSSRWMR
jgi:hypothetical protein